MFRSFLLFVLFTNLAFAIDFDNPAPGANPLQQFDGANFGGNWYYTGPYSVDTTNSIYYGTNSNTQVFSFDSPQLLEALRVYSDGYQGLLTVSDGAQSVNQQITEGSVQTVTTGWQNTSTTITITYAGGWALGITEIVIGSGGNPPPPPPPPADNPVPVANALTPASATEGGLGFTLRVDGSDFVNGAVVRWNGADRATTFVSATQLDATINAADIAAAGNASVTVFNPTPGGGLSDTLNFVIDVAPPTTSQSLNSISPNSVNINDADTVITLFGSGFTENSTVSLEGTPLTSNFVSSSQLTATVPSSLFVNDGRLAVAVTTPEAQNQLSQPVTFFVLNDGETLFYDDFNRANNADIGNGWAEKTPFIFSVENGRVVSQDSNPYAFNNNIVYRPASELVEDVEASVEFIRHGLPGSHFPQVHARVDINETQIENGALSYTAFLNDADPVTLTVTTVVDLSECYLAEWTLSESLVVGDRYRIVYRVWDNDPIRMTASLDHFVAGSWQSIAGGYVEHDDTTLPTPGLWCNIGFMPPPNDYAGTVGFAQYIYRTDDYDSFYAIQLDDPPSEPPPADNPVPQTTGLNPTNVTEGDPAFSLTVNGADFVAGAIVRINGLDRITTFVNATELSADILAADIATAGNATIEVFNPAPGGGVSNAQTLTIDPVGGPPPPPPPPQGATTVDFDSPAPPTTLFGEYEGINFGYVWAWTGPYNVDPSNSIYVSPNVNDQTFTFVNPQVLNSIQVFTTGPDRLLTITDGVQIVTQTISAGSLQTVNTGWANPSTTITVSYPGGWELGITEIVYSD